MFVACLSRAENSSIYMEICAHFQATLLAIYPPTIPNKSRERDLFNQLVESVGTEWNWLYVTQPWHQSFSKRFSCDGPKAFNIIVSVCVTRKRSSSIGNIKECWVILMAWSCFPCCCWCSSGFALKGHKMCVHFRQFVYCCLLFSVDVHLYMYASFELLLTLLQK